MKPLSSFAVVAVSTVLAALVAAPSAETAPTVLDGQKIFLAQKCETCHSVSKAEVKQTGKVKGGDLSAVEVKDATVLGQYLRKKVQIKGKNHVKPFTGTDEELGAMIAWLQKQKQ